MGSFQRMGYIGLPARNGLPGLQEMRQMPPTVERQKGPSTPWKHAN
jgi:hypothetical protein